MERTSSGGELAHEALSFGLRLFLAHGGEAVDGWWAVGCIADGIAIDSLTPEIFGSEIGAW